MQGDSSLAATPQGMYSAIDRWSSGTADELPAEGAGFLDDLAERAAGGIRDGLAVLELGIGAEDYPIQ